MASAFRFLSISWRSTADDGVREVHLNALERLLANSETNIEKVMDGEQ